MRQVWLVAAFTVLSLAPSACVRSPSAPETTTRFLGTWSGSVNGPGMSGGAMTLTFTRETGAYPELRVAGDWIAMYPETRFNSAGTFSGGSTTANAVVLEFSPMVVACPGQPGGAATKSALATLLVDSQRMSGRLVVLDCPGGEMEVNRR